MMLNENLLEAFLDCVEGVYALEEDTYKIVYANHFLSESRGRRIEGEPCYRALMGRDTPCLFCPALREDDTAFYSWEWFDPISGMWLKIKNRLVTVDGVRYRVGNLNAVTDMMDLSREAVTEMGALNRVIQQYNQTKNELEYESTHDRMTRLYNRNQYIHDMSLSGTVRSAGALFFDLNNLKEVNDRYRHAAGDMLLRRLAASLGPADSPDRRVYRIGGDEFVVLYKNCTEAELSDCLSGILADLCRRNKGEELTCIAAVGVAWSDEIIDLEE
ncbi:MAG: GGDEF domain-containing protein, partial [Lachnospiraceae bacterium]